MREPSGVGHTRTTEADICGDDVGEGDLEALLDQADHADPSDGGVEGVGEAEAAAEANCEQREQETDQVTGRQPAGGGQAQRLTLNITQY